MPRRRRSAQALAGPLRAEGARGYGSGVDDRRRRRSPRSCSRRATSRSFVTNVDLTQARIGGLGTDVARRFLEELAENAGLILHVRLLDGTDSSTCSRRSSRRSASRSAQACEPTGGTAMSDKTRRPHRGRAGAVPGRAVLAGDRAGGFVFVSGQLGLKPGDTAISGGIEEQTEQVFANLRAILEEAGSGLDRLVKTTVFLQQPRRLPGDERVYATHVGDAAARARDGRGREAAVRRARRDRGDRTAVGRSAGPARMAGCARRSRTTSARSGSTPTSSAAPCATSCSGSTRRTRTSSCPASTPTGLRAALAPHGRVEDLVVAGRLVGVRLHPRDRPDPAADPGRDRVRAAARGGRAPGLDATTSRSSPTPSLSVEDDMRRRDFTVNAMARRLETGELVDPLDGQADLEAGRLRTVSPQSFREDPLRLVRALRFVSQLGFEPDEDTARPDARGGAGSAARLRRAHRRRSRRGRDGRAVEAAARAEPARALRLARDTGVLVELLPEFGPAIGFDQESRYHDLTVDEHTFAVVQAAADAGLLARRSARRALPRPRQADRRLARARRPPPLLREARLRRARTRPGRRRPRRRSAAPASLSECAAQTRRRASCATTCSSRGRATPSAPGVSCAATGTSSRSTSSTTSSPTCSASEEPTASRRPSRRSSGWSDSARSSSRSRRARTGCADLAVDGDDLIALGFQPGPRLGRNAPRAPRRRRGRARPEHARPAAHAGARSGC